MVKSGFYIKLIILVFLLGCKDVDPYDCEKIIEVDNKFPIELETWLSIPSESESRFLQINSSDGLSESIKLEHWISSRTFQNEKCEKVTYHSRSQKYTSSMSGYNFEIKLEQDINSGVSSFDIINNKTDDYYTKVVFDSFYDNNYLLLSMERKWGAKDVILDTCFNCFYNIGKLTVDDETYANTYVLEDPFRYTSYSVTDIKKIWIVKRRGIIKFKDIFGRTWVVKDLK